VSLRTRAALWTAAAVVLAVLAVAVAARQAAESSLVAAVDADLRALAAVAPRAVQEGRTGPGGGRLAELRGEGHGHGQHGPAVLAAADGLVTVLGPDGRPLDPAAAVPVPARAAAIARDGGGPSLDTVEVADDRLRTLTLALPGGGAVQLTRSLAEVDDALDRLTGRLVLIGLVATLLAAGVALLLSDRLTRPVGRLTLAAEEVARTQQLTTRIAPAGDDELARLGRAFDAMLASLEEARQAQVQLVADASHELRTPLTSLRTNIDLLRSGVELPTEDHRRLLDDLGEQLVEFGALVDGLVALARGERPPDDPVALRLDELVADVVRGVRRDHPDASVQLALTPCRVIGDADRLARAVRNLVVNAIVHGGGDVEVTVADGIVRVRDHGPGIAPDDRTRVLARFHRAPEARGRPGSGLGLAIVDQVARTHGGAVVIDAAEGGGTVAELRLHDPDGHVDAASR
jgi:two-component system, OmpR family, sensor histidine kinase MprB